MFLYDLKVAAISMANSRLLTAVTVGAIAVGIGVWMAAFSLYHAMSANPLAHKNDRLFAVTLDLKSNEAQVTRYDPHPTWPPYQLTYRDAEALFDSAIPTRKVRMYRTVGALDPTVANVRPARVSIRLTSADFFSLFDAPFLYGRGWSAAADDGPQPQIVISRHINDYAFGGANSVGRTLTLNGATFRIVGVLADWMPRPRVYDLNNGAFDVPEDVYIPFLQGTQLSLRSTGNMTCMRERGAQRTFQDTLQSECVWIQFWAELPNAEARKRFQQFIDAYVTDQKRTGRFPRPLNNRLVPVDQWIDMNDVVGTEVRLLLLLGVLFLAVCIFNAVGLLLAKFLRTAPGASVRRALGASRWDIFRGYMAELALTGAAGGVGGIVLCAFGLLGFRYLAQSSFLPQADRVQADQLLSSLTRLDVSMVMAGLGTAVLAGLIAGAYPAWRVCRVAPTAHLKSE